MTVDRFGIFFSGAVTMVLLLAFVQDWMGMEAYLQFARDNWTTMSPWWWPPLVLVTIYFGLRVKQRFDS